jgi:hypothetical protein
MLLMMMSLIKWIVFLFINYRSHISNKKPPHLHEAVFLFHQPELMIFTLNYLRPRTVFLTTVARVAGLTAADLACLAKP